MTAKICEHGRQFVNCGDCWNNRCDECGATLDALNICLTHGKRASPKGPLAEEGRGRVAFEDLRFTDEEIDVLKDSHELSVVSLKLWRDTETKAMRDFTNKIYEVANKEPNMLSPTAVLERAAQEGLWEELKSNMTEMALAAIICHQQGKLRKEVNMRVSGGRIIVMSPAT